MIELGPPPMINAMKGHLADLKFAAPRTVSKTEDAVRISPHLIDHHAYAFSPKPGLHLLDIGSLYSLENA